ncbi:hypothetical protein C8R46DRAFT_1074086 [Mycena filopes]|nr:hypothetical protein C8R46DRAFT_1074086 [Mycena filopes]
MDGAKGSDETGPSIFAQLRNFNLTVPSLGSLFSSTASSPSSSSQNLVLEPYNPLDPPRPPAPMSRKGGSTEEVLTPTPSRPPSPRRFPGVKNIFTNLASRGSRNPPPPVRISVVQTQVSIEADRDDETPRYEPLTSPLGSQFIASSEYAHQLGRSGSSSSSGYQPMSASDSYTSSELNDTPPLTPESLLADISLLSPASNNAELGYAYHYDYNEGDGHEDGYTMYMQPDEEYASMRRHSMEIKEGKKPERPIDFDALLADISNDADSPDAALLTSGDPDADGSALAEDDKDEWYGLEYTLELSTRERRASETHSFSGGEHSKSRESWAAIHQGTVHPFFEDEEYYQWKNWHRYLDRQDEKRKHRRGREFKMHAKEAAWFYADEMHTRDVMSWQQEVHGYASKDVYERLAILESHRPDPYYPPVNHDLAWHLKRSRSVASIRELRPLPEPAPPVPKQFLSRNI